MTVAATDATSGVARVEYAIGTGSWRTYDGPVAAPDTSQHRVSFRAVDAAGNAETPKVVTIPADISGPLTGNVAPIATVSASYTAGWNSVGALHDDADPANPSQAQIWGTWSGTRPATQWVRYDWSRPVRLTGAELKFWRDSEPGTGDGVVRPDSWVLEYWDDAAQSWAPVANASGYGTSTTAFNTVTFDPVITSRLRATFSANGNGSTYSAVAVTEWRAFADDPGTGGPEPELPVTVTAQARCLAGKAYVAVVATHGHDAPVDLVLETPNGSRSFPAVAPGKSAYQSFAVRAAAVEAGTVVVRATSTVDGVEVTTETEAEHAALGCG
ncbi:OmpL47-type beta-barrel domain-containing protein [Cellulosimicrobium cellulans]|uniref:OmpL47-type beta-barrel domain-containing protein n=1 Tax=Cellulosimicrobium cellulans TaxID=1710 RepID=UPI003809A6EE